MTNLTDNIYEADRYYVAEAMRRGGGFMTALADALLKADKDNTRRILSTWGQEIQRQYSQYVGTNRVE